MAYSSMKEWLAYETSCGKWDDYHIELYNMWWCDTIIDGD